MDGRAKVLNTLGLTARIMESGTERLNRLKTQFGLPPTAISQDKQAV
jgi:hypothetical protein